MRIFKKLLPLILSIVILGYIIYFTKPPNSWPEASSFQILSFFIPFLLFTTFTINLFISYLPRSFAIALSLMLLLVLKAVNELNLLTTAEVSLLVFLFFIFLKKPPFSRKDRSINKDVPIPKLRLNNEASRSKLKNLGRRN